jgi:hypothetical protein
MSGLRRKRSLRGLGARWLEPDESTLEEYEHRIKNIKRDLSPTQEKQLLLFDATGDFEYGATNLRETMRVLEEKGYLKDKDRKLWVTRKGAEYAEAHGSDILSDRFLAKEKHKKEMSPGEARDMQRQLYKGSKAVEISKRKMIPEKQGQMTLFGGLGTFKKYTPKERAEANKRNYTNKQLRDFNHLVGTAARKLREYDINNTHDVKRAWDDFNNYYLKDLRQYVLDLLVENKAHLNIPAMAVSRYKKTNPVSYVSETPEIIVMAMTNPSLLSEYLPEEKVTSQTRISKPKSLEEKQEAVKALIRRLPNPVTGKKEKIIPEKQGQMTLFGGARL